MSGDAFELVLARLDVRARNGTTATAICPAHEDRSPSLSVTRGDDRALVHCHAACETSDVLAAVGLVERDLFDRRNGDTDTPERRRIVATYPYVDESGTVLSEVVRYAPKDFRQRRPDGRGGHVWSIGDTRRVLYRLPSVLAAVAAGSTVLVCEGEKDVEALEAAGYVATCSPAGAGKWSRVPDAVATLTGADVIVVADRDPAGYAHARDVARSLIGSAASVLVAEPAIGNDVAEHLGAGRTVDELLAVAGTADGDPPLDEWLSEGIKPSDPGELDDEVASPPADTLDVFVGWDKFWARDRREAEWLYPPILARGRGHAIFAAHKVGKSLVLLDIAARLATGRDPVVVVYLDYEMGEDDLYERLADMGYGADTDLSRLRYALLPSLPPLDQPDGAAALFAILDAVEAAHPDHHVVVVIDTTGRAVAGEENSADTIRGFYRWTGLGLRQRGATWARLDHAGKDPTRGQRGSSAKGDDVDVVWRITPADGGLLLRREASRMSWIPERVALHRSVDPLRFVVADGMWPAGTAEVAGLLDGLGVPVDAGERPAGQALRDAGHRRSQAIVRAAQRWRREAALGALR